MRVLLAGGRGFLGAALAQDLRSHGHEALILTRSQEIQPGWIHWDGRSQGEWTTAIEEVDAVVNATGYGLEHWPWTQSRKRRFTDSRVVPGQCLATAIQGARHRPKTLIQLSGINYYGLEGAGAADESTVAGTDFLARLAVECEAATRGVEQAGVRWVAARQGVVLDADGGFLPLMALPVRLLVGGRLGSGRQPVPWIHRGDQVRAVRFLLETVGARGAYNLVAPEPITNAQLMEALARALRRPFWLPVPEFLLRGILGGMGDLVLEGRYSLPKRLLDLGFRFRFPTLELALRDVFDGRNRDSASSSK
jgi:hypothetical protein